MLTVATAALAVASYAQESRWVSAWAAAHNVGVNTPAVFSSAFIGVAGSGAAIVPDTNRRLTFSGANGLTLAPGESAWSDAVSFEVKAFERLTVSLDVIRRQM